MRLAIGLLVVATGVVATGVIATGAIATVAHAQDVTPTFHAEGAAQVMLTPSLRDRFDWGAAGSARAGLEVLGPIAIQLSFASALFPVPSQSPGNLYAIELGVRAFFRIDPGPLGGPFADINGGVGMTGDLVRFLFDVGAGWDFFPVSIFGVGPVVRYQQIVQGDGDSAHVLGFGVNVTLRIDLGHAPPPTAEPIPETDEDGDGVPDSRDRCRGESEDVDGFSDDDGCPDPDNDSDGIDDGADQCPSAAEIRNGFQDEDGCPDEAPVIAAPTNDGEVMTQVVLFRLGSDRVSARGRPAIDEVCQILHDNPNAHVRVIGHADEQGTAAGNHRLGATRAGSVAEQLVLCGIDPARIQSISYGATRPACSDATEDCHVQNRRVGFELIRDPH